MTGAEYDELDFQEEAMLGSPQFPPVRARRGGIQYPERNTMKDDPTEIAVIDNALDVARAARRKAALKHEKATRCLSELDHELSELIRQRRKAEIPEEPAPGKVISFNLQFGGRTYLYAARNCDGRWFRTGPTCPPNGETWESLIRFIQGSEFPATITVYGIRENTRISVNNPG